MLMVRLILQLLSRTTAHSTTRSYPILPIQTVIRRVQIIHSLITKAIIKDPTNPAKTINGI